MYDWIKSLKIWWSYYWRSLLLSTAGMIAIIMPYAIIGYALGFFAFDRGMAWDTYILAKSLYILGFIVAMIYLILCINAYCWNALPSISYRNFQVILMRDGKWQLAYGKFDALCVLWSILWRAAIISILVVPISILMSMLLGPIVLALNAMIGGSLVFLMVPLGIIAYILLLLLFNVGPYHWMLNRKRTGRYLLIEEKKWEE